MFCTIFEAERGFYWHNFSKPKLYKFVRPPTPLSEALKFKSFVGKNGREQVVLCIPYDSKNTSCCVDFIPIPLHTVIAFSSVAYLVGV